MGLYMGLSLSIWAWPEAQSGGNGAPDLGYWVSIRLWPEAHSGGWGQWPEMCSLGHGPGGGVHGSHVGTSGARGFMGHMGAWASRGVPGAPGAIWVPGVPCARGPRALGPGGSWVTWAPGRPGASQGPGTSGQGPGTMGQGPGIEGLHFNFCTVEFACSLLAVSLQTATKLQANSIVPFFRFSNFSDFPEIF